MNYLLDTDTIIYSLNNHERVNENFRKYRNAPKSISVVSYGELVYGAKKSRFVEKNLAKVHRVAELFPILEISRAVMETFAELKATLEKSGTPIADMDLLIGATALTHNLVLVTNNEKHYRRVTGLEIENWAI